MCAFQELEQLLPDDGHAPGAVAFQVDGQNGVVDRQPQQEPALALPLGEGHPDALPVVRGDGPVLLLGVRLQGGDEGFPAGPEILLGDGQADLGGLHRLPQGGQQVWSRSLPSLRREAILMRIFVTR